MHHRGRTAVDKVKAVARLGDVIAQLCLLGFDQVVFERCDFALCQCAACRRNDQRNCRHRHESVERASKTAFERSIASGKKAAHVMNRYARNHTRIKVLCRSVGPSQIGDE